MAFLARNVNESIAKWEFYWVKEFDAAVDIILKPSTTTLYSYYVVLTESTVDASFFSPLKETLPLNKLSVGLNHPDLFGNAWNATEKEIFQQ